MRNAIKNYGAFDDSLARTLVWMSAWDMTRDGELPVSDWVALVTAAIDTEPEVSVVGVLLRYTKLATDFYANPLRRASYYKSLANALYDAAHNADPGSEHQLQFVRGLISFATEPSHLEWFAGLVEGTNHLEGLKIDVDLRWGLLTRLTTTGYWQPSRIDDELARDNTAFGAQSAAFARAAVPTAEAKAAAWTLLTETKDVANSIYQYTAMGFRQPEQAALLEPYVSQFFVDAEAVCELHEHHMAEDFLLFAFPAVFVEEATVEMATEYLDTRADGNVALLRYVREGRANLIRAMRARQADL
mgnify:CR=1 FL=1